MYNSCEAYWTCEQVADTYAGWTVLAGGSAYQTAQKNAKASKK
jgi:hypothetical protein